MMLPGTYEEALITGSSLQKGKGSDDPVVLIHFLADSETITAYLYTTPGAWEYTAKKLAACGFDPSEHDLNLAALDLEGDANPIVGTHVRIVVKEETYEGKVRSKVDWIGPAMGVERMAPDEVVSFTKALRQRLVASQGTPRAKTASKATTTRPRAVAAASNEDPF